MASNGVSREASRSAPSSRPVLAAVAQQNARNHPLFGVLDFIAAKTQSNTSAIAAVDVRLEKLEDSVSRIAELQKELKQLVEQQKEYNFSIEKTKYKVNPFGLVAPPIYYTAIGCSSNWSSKFVLW